LGQPSQFYTGVCEQKRQSEERTSEREAEKSALLEAITRERLVEIQQAGKGLAGDVVICE
jgi:hypothetical protein